MSRVHIYNGLIYIGANFHGNDPRDWVPGTAFQLFDADDGRLVVKGEYTGDAWVGRGDNGVVYVNITRGAFLDSFIMAEHPTIESVQYDAGWRHAMGQKRRGKPGQSWSSDFFSGWQSAWNERKKAGV